MSQILTLSEMFVWIVHIEYHIVHFMSQFDYRLGRTIILCHRYNILLVIGLGSPVSMLVFPENVPPPQQYKTKLGGSLN